MASELRDWDWDGFRTQLLLLGVACSAPGGGVLTHGRGLELVSLEGIWGVRNCKYWFSFLKYSSLWDYPELTRKSRVLQCFNFRHPSHLTKVLMWYWKWKCKNDELEMHFRKVISKFTVPQLLHEKDRAELWFERALNLEEWKLLVNLKRQQDEDYHPRELPGGQDHNGPGAAQGDWARSRFLHWKCKRLDYKALSQ